MIDEDVAALFQISLKNLNQRVNRNKQRFPSDFMFLPTSEEWEQLQLQGNFARKIGIDQIQVVFTEAGILMASGLINSDVAVKVSIAIVNQFFNMVKIFK